MSFTVDTKRVGFQGSIVPAKDSSLNSTQIEEGIACINRQVGWGHHHGFTMIYLDKHMKSSDACLVLLALENKEIVGYAISRPDENPKTRYLSFIATVKKSHGIGTALLNQVFSDMETTGDDELTFDARSTAIEFYKKYAIQQKKEISVIVSGSYRNGDPKYVVQIKK